MAASSSTNLVNPATEQTFRTVEMTSEAELGVILERMRVAQKKWREVPVRERVEICRGFVDTFRGMRETVALDITRQMGKPLVQAQREVDTMLDRAETMLRLATAGLEDEVLEPKPGLQRFIRREPLGIVLDIPAWNYPLLIAVNVVLPALLAGNAVLIKHARLTPLCGDAFVDAFRQTKLPGELVASIHVGHKTVTRLIAGRAVDFISFTGSVEGGREVYREASGQLLDMGLELGGKDPALVCEDANFDFAVTNLVDGAFYNAGQSCCAVERIYVARPLFAKFADAFVAEVRKYTLGDPFDAATRLGPLVADRQRLRVRGFIDTGVAEGARLVTGGTAVPEGLERGFFVRPTVFADVTADMTIAQEEIFGPVLSIMRYGDEDEALEIANGTRYGLAGGVWAADAERAAAFAARMKTGQVDINGGAFNPVAPFGGYKASGLGRELGRHGLAEFLTYQSQQF